MSKNAVLLLVLVFLAASCLTVALPVKAEPKTITVPDHYPTIQEAINAANENDIVFVKRGAYHEEAININKSVSLIGEDVEETILSLHPPLIQVAYLLNWFWVPDTAIKINASDVKLQGFTINLPNDDYGVGSGIYAVGDGISFTDNTVANRSVYLSGAMLNITCNSLSGTLEIAGSNITVANNTIKEDLKVQGSFNLVSDNKIGSGYYWSGIHLDGSFNCVVGNSFSSMSTDDSNFNVIIGNSFANLDMTKYGKGGCSNTIISKNRVAGNRGINDGIWLYEGENNTISANSICNCENGLTLGTSGSTAVSNSIYLNNFVNNTNHIICLSGSDHTVNRFDNGVKGNYYDDYQGNDANWDGVGDSPYTVQETHWDEELKRDVTIVFFQDNYPLMSPFDIDSFSIELPDWAEVLLGPSAKPETQKPHPVALVVAVVIAVVLAGAGLLVYLKKRQRGKRA